MFPSKQAKIHAFLRNNYAKYQMMRPPFTVSCVYGAVYIEMPAPDRHKRPMSVISVLVAIKHQPNGRNRITKINLNNC